MVILYSEVGGVDWDVYIYIGRGLYIGTWFR